MGAYMRTPEFLKHEQEWKNHLKTVMGNDYYVIANSDKKTGK
jgi:hypothetical protein